MRRTNKTIVDLLDTDNIFRIYQELCDSLIERIKERIGDEEFVIDGEGFLSVYETRDGKLSYGRIVSIRNITSIRNKDGDLSFRFKNGNALFWISESYFCRIFQSVPFLCYILNIVENGRGNKE